MSGQTLSPPVRQRRARLSGLHTVAAAIAAGVAWILLSLPADRKMVGLTIALLSGSVGVLLLRSPRDVLSPGKFLAVILLWFFGVAPVLQLASNRFSGYHLADPADSFLAAAVMVAMYGGAFWFGLRLVRPRGRRPPTAPMSAVRTRRVVVGYLLVGAAAWAVYFDAMGGLLNFLTYLQNRTQMSAGLGYVFLAANLFQVGALLAAVCDASGTRILPRPIVYAALAISFAVILLIGMRSRALMYLAILFIAYYSVGVRMSRVRLAALGIAGMLVIFAAGKLRLLGAGSGAIFDRRALIEAVTATGEDYIESAIVDYGHFDRLSMVYEYVPDRIDHQWGGTSAAVALVPVPRKMFPEKPVGSGPLLANAFRPGAWDLEAGWTSGVTPTIVGEMFLNFSWPGLIVGGLVLGVVAGLAHRRWAVGGRGPLDAVQYAVFAVMWVASGALGEFYGTVIMYAVYALPVGLAGRLAPPRRAAAQTVPFAGVNT